MRRYSTLRRLTICLLFPAYLAACSSWHVQEVSPQQLVTEVTLRVQGTVTAAADGSPIAGATVSVEKQEGFTRRSLWRAWTDNQGDYSLSFVLTGSCLEGQLRILASAEGFRSQFNRFRDPFRCTEEVQTFDFQLERHRWEVGGAGP